MIFHSLTGRTPPATQRNNYLYRAKSHTLSHSLLACLLAYRADNPKDGGEVLDAKLAAEHRKGLVGVEGRHSVLQLPQLQRVRLADQVRADAQRLPQLDEGRPHLVRQRQRVARARGLVVPGRGLAAALALGQARGREVIQQQRHIEGPRQACQLQQPLGDHKGTRREEGLRGRVAVAGPARAFVVAGLVR